MAQPLSQRPIRPSSSTAATKSTGPRQGLILIGAVAVIGGAAFTSWFFFRSNAEVDQSRASVAAESPAQPPLGETAISAGNFPDKASADASDPAAKDVAVASAGDEDALPGPGETAIDASNSGAPALGVATASAVVAGASAAPRPSGTKTFVDCELCPHMTVLPAGSFTMGSPEDEPGRFAYEGPQHEVTLKSFAIGTYEITFDQWAACAEDGGCRNYEPADAGFGRGTRPALYISWNDAKAFASWLTRKTSRTYRLPTEAEWEYAARADTTTAYWWGGRFDDTLAPRGATREVSALKANPFGLYGMLGGAGEWVEDCYVNNFAAAPTDGAPVLSGDCGRRIVRGGSWRSDAAGMRAANRQRIGVNVRDSALGFRVVAELK